MATVPLAGRTLIALAALFLTACSGGDAPEDAQPAESQAPTDAAAPAQEPAAPADQPGVPDGVANSRATVTVDGQTWEFAPFLCAVGTEQTGSDTFSFSSDGSANGEGDVRLQFQVNARDDTGQGRLLGDGVVYDFTVYDWGSDTPTVDLSGEATEGVTIGPGSLAVDGVFTSIDGTSHVVVVDAVCGP